MTATRRFLPVAGCLLACAFCAARARAADNPYLYGIHWWGYTTGNPVDSTPATLLGAPTYGGWDVETVLTHSASWWAPAYFVNLYQNLYTTRNITLITRIDYNWGETVPSPTNPNYAGWPASVTNVVSTLGNYCHLWIIGNEPNLIGEGTNWPSNQITPAGYATIYRNVRNAIRASTPSGPAGTHLVLIAPPSPGGIINGVRWMAGATWLGQVLDNIPAAEVDGFAIHSYGGTVSDFRQGYSEQLTVIDARGHAAKPVYITEWNRYATPGNAGEEASAAQFCKDAFADVNAWNQDPCNHNIVSMSWFVYDANQQAAGGWNGYSIEYWKDNGNAAGSSSDLFTAFGQAVAMRYPAGNIGQPVLSNPNNMTATTPTGANVAILSTQVATDSVYAAGAEGTYAIDGITSAGSKWVSGGASPPHWLKLDLGASKAVTGFVVRHAGAGGEPSYFNTQSFRIQSGTTFDGPWTDEVTVCNSAQTINVSQRSYPSPKQLRYVRLLINDAGIDNYARIPEFEVWAQGPPVANFSGTPLYGKAPMTVQFTDASTGSPSTWNWNFGNGQTSTTPSPSYTYTTPGVYTVSLTVTSAGGNNTMTRTNYVTVLAVGADFDGDTDIDMADFAHLQECLTGTGVAVSRPACVDAQLDLDNDVDATDMTMFLDCMSGANVAATAACQ